MGKILVIRGGAIGDFILTLPVLSALRRHFPEARLEVLGYPHVVQLALAGGLADQVTSIEARALAGFFARGGELDERLTQFFGAFNLIVSYLFDPDRVFQTNVEACSKAQFIAGPHRPDPKSALHATEVFLQPLERLAIFNADPVPSLDFKTQQTSMHRSVEACERRNLGGSERGQMGGADASSGPMLPRATASTQWLACHPGSGSESKNWPQDRWAELLMRLGKATEYNFLLIGGEAEGDRLARLASDLPRDRIEIAQNLALVELALRLRECRFYLGHDSGISHLAGAVGLEGLILWGNTDLAVWGPRGGKLRVLRAHQALSDIPVERVIRELNVLFQVRVHAHPDEPGVRH